MVKRRVAVAGDPTKGSADIDLTGQTFGYWTVVEPAEKKQGKQYYHCRCICGKKGTMKVYRQLQKRDIAEGGYQFAPLKNNKTRVIKLSPFVLKLLEKQKIKQREDKLAAGDLWQGFQTIEEQKPILCSQQRREIISVVLICTTTLSGSPLRLAR